MVSACPSRYIETRFHKDLICGKNSNNYMELWNNKLVNCNSVIRKNVTQVL